MSWTDLARNGRILVVDDAMENIQILHHALREEHEVLFALDGEQALQIALDQQPDLILLDAVMPGMDGYETARQVRQLANGRDCLMIALTGWGQGDARQRTVEAGFDFHITKPVDYTAIVALLERHLAGASPN